MTSSSALMAADVRLDLEERTLHLAVEETFEEIGRRWMLWAANGRAIQPDHDRDHSAVSPASSKQDACDYVPPRLAYVYAGTAILRTITSPRRIPHGPVPSTGSHADRRPAHLTYGPAHGLDLALQANMDADMDLDTASVKTAPGPSLPIISTRSRAPLSPTPPAPRGASPHASESRAHVSPSGMGSSLNENAHVREMRAQTLNRPQDRAQRHTHTLNGRQHGLGYKSTPWGNKDGTDSLGDDTMTVTNGGE
ncbi:hypothetical protein JB92DRAFT_3120318 [Gautieria morchelliformis]|nr:hypothetical protein JB92DRAFT_3120318 [Gautieria morchelliformis]